MATIDTSLTQPWDHEHKGHECVFVQYPGMSKPVCFKCQHANLYRARKAADKTWSIGPAQDRHYKTKGRRSK